MTDPRHDFDDLFVRFTDGSITDDELAMLNEALASDADLRRRFQIACLAATRIGEPAHENLHIPSTPVRAASAGRTTPHRITPATWTISIAAAIVLSAAAVAIYIFVISPQSEIRDPQSAGPPLATLIEKSDEGTLATPDGFISEGRDYGPGTYALDRGTAEFMLTNSVNVKLRGATRMRMDDDMHVELVHGRADFVVPKRATGFTVVLPGGARVVDLGTRFTVDADRAPHVTVVVDEGRVNLHTMRSEGPAVITPLTANLLAQVDPNTGTLVRLIRRLELADTGEGGASDAPDPNWTLHRRSATDEPPVPTPAIVIANPHKLYLTPDADTAARWIGTRLPGGNAPSDSTHTFTTTIDLDDLDLTAVAIEGRIAVDNQVREIRLNGHPVPMPGGSITSFAKWTEFHITDGFQPGKNRIEFDVYNTPDTVARTPMGLIVEWHATETLIDTHKETTSDIEESRNQE